MSRHQYGKIFLTNIIIGGMGANIRTGLGGAEGLLAARGHRCMNECTLFKSYGDRGIWLVKNFL